MEDRKDDATGETVIFGKRVEDRAVHLDVLEGPDNLDPHAPALVAARQTPAAAG